MTRSFPLRRSLVVRLTAVSLLIALGSIAATAWLAVQTTTRAIQQEQGQALSGDATIYTEVLGFAAANHTWSQVGPKLKTLSDQTGRRIVLTTLDRHVLGDSGGAPVTLPVKATASVDPLHVDPVLLPQAGTSGIDPRAVGPFRLPPPEREDLTTLATKVAGCLATVGLPSQVRDSPSGRAQLTGLDPLSARYFASKCGLYELAEPTPTEQAALDSLNEAVNRCLQGQGAEPVKLDLDLEVLGTTDQRPTQGCLDSARREQLTPFVAPPALLFTLGPGGSPLPTFTLSRENLTRILAVTGGVLVLAAAITVLVARRLSRPLRALTEAAKQDRPAPVKSRDEVGYLAAAFNDLTARRERIEEQRKAMVGDIAHELRNPLNVIRGRLEAAEDGHLPFDHALTASLLEETVLLQHIVEDLQDLAAADAGWLRLHPEPVDAAELAGHVAAAHADRAAAAGVTLTVSARGETGFEADPVRVRQVVSNLVTNAVRHTPPGGRVTIHVSSTVDEVVIAVADTGTGIAAEDLPHVFDRFWRAEKSRNRQTGGSGLGLAIVRHLVEAHGGTVAAESEVDTGSTFTVRLPKPDLRGEDAGVRDAQDVQPPGAVAEEGDGGGGGGRAQGRAPAERDHRAAS
ncbi:HAMP domain-containing sensor histidine kinase [Amycolatopsis mongoliensis]|uniref:histidine kinase n=1 Tax=Amycolatopsis mongoliensis TaxID=715475 RepID=A0A9Y2JYL6_9PSEU|nr:HAMP domain-containing sensor histidine kinase [Amycolatopsis sp. 4-36]WIY06340.1 HAMP domain-containing sensor histidine kinase [Amycolatopsis sp. 4-36]